jgi:quercetin dioxygenase-like cupin family protein
MTETIMTKRLKSAARLRNAALLALAAGAFIAPAYAGVCPADKMKAGARTSGETAPKDVTDTELSSIDLGEEIDGFDGRLLRFRKLVVLPGGVVPWHDHTDRPALILTAEGEITEFRSDCAVGVVHKAGEISRETKGLMHWWKNEGKTPAVLYAADVKRAQ